MSGRVRGVDTLVLGTSAKAWEFESLHAQIKGNDYRSFFYANFLFAHRPLTQDCCSVFATTGVLPCRVSCLVRLMRFAYDASESLHAQIKGNDGRSFFLCQFFICAQASHSGLLLSIRNNRSSTRSGILPRKARAARQRCKRIRLGVFLIRQQK